MFGQRGTESILRIELQSGERTSKNLAYPLPLQPTKGVIEGDTLYIHGFDTQGKADRISLDLSLEGSLSSGRGLLNFAFIVVGLIMIVTQAYLLIEKATHVKKA